MMMPSLKAWWTDILLRCDDSGWKELNESSLNRKHPPLHYDRQGFPICLGTWARLFENFDYKVVKQTQLSNGYWVSTVWLGLDHSFMPGAPEFFETMVKDRETGDWMDDQARYSDEESAREGHRRMVYEYSRKPKYKRDTSGSNKAAD
jgi:hypothetical protein